MRAQGACRRGRAKAAAGRLQKSACNQASAGPRHREALLADEWIACEVTELDKTYEGYYRLCLRVILEALKAPKVWYRAKEAEDK